MLKILQLPVLDDNYIYLLHDPVSLETAVVDPALPQPVLDTLAENSWQLNYVFNTHHHWDHVDGNLALKKQTGCKIIASEYDQNRIPGIDISVNHGDKIKLGTTTMEIIATPGHTSGHISYYCAASHALFCGDTLFSMGCGRLFEGTAEQMWRSLQLLQALPDCTRIYCAHEYTQTNGSFAMTLEADNPALQQRLAEVTQLRKKKQSTIPSTLFQELATNPFLRTQSPSIQKKIGMVGQPAVKVFAKIRQLKDNF